MSNAAPKDIRDTTVLVAISNFHTRAIVLNILRGAAISRVRVAESAAEALEVLRASRVDVVLVEWEAAGIDALVFAKAVRTGRAGPDQSMPIVVVTSNSALADVEAARLAGITEYALKPLSAAALLSRIESVQRNPRPFVKAETYVGPCRRRRSQSAYRGPMRRRDDAIEDELGDLINRAAKDRIRAAVKQVADIAQRLTSSDVAGLRLLLQAARDASLAAEACKDDPMARAAGSLERYAENAAEDQRFDTEVIDLHVGALMQLVSLRSAERTLRERLVRDLIRVAQLRLQKSRILASV